MKAYTVYAGSTEEAAVYSVWELLLKGFQKRGLLSWDLIAPKRKGHPWQKQEHVSGD